LRARPRHVDLVIETGLKPHDVVRPGADCRRGGRDHDDLEGGSAAAGGRIIAAGDARIYAEARRLLTT